MENKNANVKKVNFIINEILHIFNRIDYTGDNEIDRIRKLGIVTTIDRLTSSEPKF